MRSTLLHYSSLHQLRLRFFFMLMISASLVVLAPHLISTLFAQALQCPKGEVMVGIEADGGVQCKPLISVLKSLDDSVLEGEYMHFFEEVKRRRKRKEREETKKFFEGLIQLLRKSGEHTYDAHPSFLKNMPLDKLASMARVIPQMRDGQYIGFKIVGVRRGRLLAYLGFKNGDILTSINEVALDSMQATLKIADVFTQSEGIRIDFLRRSHPRSVMVNTLSPDEWAQKYPKAHKGASEGRVE
jgi:hypothetical protein